MSKEVLIEELRERVLCGCSLDCFNEYEKKIYLEWLEEDNRLYSQFIDEMEAKEKENTRDTKDGLKAFNERLAIYANLYGSNTQEEVDLLYTIARGAVYSVLNGVMKNSYTELLSRLKREVYFDKKVLDAIDYLSLKACNLLEYDKNGSLKSVKPNDEALKIAKVVHDSVMSDSLDLVHEAVVTILEQCKRQLEEEGSIDLLRPYTVRRLKKRVYIKKEDSVDGWETVELVPIKEVYKSVRYAIMNNKSVQVDPANGYSYIDDMVTDPENETDSGEVIFLRSGKYCDIGGHVKDFNGAETMYTPSKWTYEELNSIIDCLELTKAQNEILKLRLQGYSVKSISTYKGVKDGTVKKIITQIQKKWTEKGAYWQYYKMMK